MNLEIAWGTESGMHLDLLLAQSALQAAGRQALYQAGSPQSHSSHT